MKRCVTVYLMLAGCVGSGCQNRPPDKREQMVQQNVQRRLDRVEGELKWQANREAQGPAKMQATWDMFMKDQKACVVKTQENGNALVQFVRHDFERFEKRQPEYKKEITRQVMGDFDHAADTSVLLFP